MFPNCVVNATHTVTSTTWFVFALTFVSIYINLALYFYVYNNFRSGVKNLYSFSRSVMWIVASTSVLLFAPVLFELEIAKNEERQRSEQKQVSKLFYLVF